MNDKIKAKAFVSSAAVTMPTAAEREKTSKRGGRGIYPLDKLEVGKSIAVIGRAARQLSTTVSTWNAKKLPVLDKNGAPVLQPVKDDDGKPVKGVDGKAEMVAVTRKFFAVDTDPATDPEGANARIWREQ